MFINDGDDRSRAKRNNLSNTVLLVQYSGPPEHMHQFQIDIIFLFICRIVGLHHWQVARTETKYDLR